MRKRLALLGIAIICALSPAWAQEKDSSLRVWEALINCKDEFGDHAALQKAFIIDGWAREDDGNTPLAIFTADNRTVIASFTRTGARTAGCMAAAKGMSLAKTAALAEQFASNSGDLNAHPSEKLAWVWSSAQKQTWLGVTEKKKNFSIFRAYSIAFMER